MLKIVKDLLTWMRMELWTFCLKVQQWRDINSLRINGLWVSSRSIVSQPSPIIIPLSNAQFKLLFLDFYIQKHQFIINHSKTRKLSFITIMTQKSFFSINILSFVFIKSFNSIYLCCFFYISCKESYASSPSTLNTLSSEYLNSSLFCKAAKFLSKYFSNKNFKDNIMNIPTKLTIKLLRIFPVLFLLSQTSKNIENVVI